MAYALLIIENPQRRRALDEESGRVGYESMERFARGLRERGVLRAAEALKSDTEGVRMQRRDGRSVVMDGPFAEAKELIGGFFILECDTRAEALAIAQACPAIEWATLEVRELGPCFT